MRLLIYLFFVLLLAGFVSAYPFVVGFDDYPMNKSKADKIIGLIPEELFIGLDKIVFSNSKCVFTEINFLVDGYETRCAKAYFNYWTNGANKITIGEFDARSEEEVLRDLLHELGHLADWRVLGWKYYFVSEVDKELRAEIFGNNKFNEILKRNVTTYYYGI